MQSSRRASEMQLLGDSDEIAQVAKLDLVIHTHIVSIKMNKIFDIWNDCGHDGSQEVIPCPTPQSHRIFLLSSPAEVTTSCCAASSPAMSPPFVPSTSSGSRNN